jgi:alpha-tubulin suppressor-like RCC1 family protein
MDPHISTFPLNYTLNVYKDEINLMICCFQRFARYFISLFDLFIPSEIIRLIILLYIDIKIYPSDYRIYCGKDDSLILYNGIIYTSGAKNCGQGSTHDSNGKKIKTFTEMSSFFSSNINKNNKIVSASIGSEHCSFINNNGDLYMSGSNGFGQLGIHVGMQDLLPRFYHVPIQIMNIKNVIQSSCGQAHTFILTKNGLFSAGDNMFGQLGLSKFNFPNDSFTLVPLNNVIDIKCKHHHSMALTKEGLFGCGLNDFHQLGITDLSIDKFNSFQKININNIISFSTGNDHSIALTTEGLFITGCRINNLGSSTSTTFIKISNRKDIISFSCGFGFSMILTKTGLFSSGSNEFGELGYYSGEQSDRSIEYFKKVNIYGGLAISLSCGYSHTIIDTDQGLYGCGYNKKNQLGLDRDLQYTETIHIFVKIPFKK